MLNILISAEEIHRCASQTSVRSRFPSGPASSANETDREIVRQQWTFTPTGSTQQIENYSVELKSVTKLELVIDPDRGRGHSLAALNALRLA
jgi:hypothetical protein